MVKERPIMEFLGLTILNFSKLELLASVFLIGYYIWYYWGVLSEGPYITEALVKILLWQALGTFIVAGCYSAYQFRTDKIPE